MRIINLVAITRQVNLQINDLVLKNIKSGDATFSESDITPLLQTMQETVRKTESLCHKRNAKPEDLPNPSFRAYQWLKFLSQRKWLLAHIYALKEFHHLLEVAFPKVNPWKSLQTIQIDYYHSSYLFRAKRKDGRIYLEINEGFIGAPAKVKQTILETALKRRTATRLKVIKDYAATPNYQKIHSVLQTNTGQNHQAGLGKTFNLAEIFASLNRQYFQGQMEQPRLSWSVRKSMRRLGTYHPDSDTITISKRLDSPEIPQYLVEYVMYHEMLHKKIGLKTMNGRRYAHTAVFRKAEKQFEHYQEAEQLIKRLNQA